MKTAIDVITKGYNAIQQNGVEFKIIAGTGTLLNIRENPNSEILSIDVSKVQKFIIVM